MLELPESCNIAREVNENLTGKKIKGVVVEQSPHRFAFFSEDKQNYEAMLRGQTIVAGCYHGGIVEIDTEDYIVYFSDGAYPRYFEGNKEPKKHQLLISFEDGTSISVSVQMYGYIGVCKKGQCSHEYYCSSSEKPDPLEDKFTLDYFKGLYKPGKNKLTVKGFLATDQRIPGLGNGVLQDILWRAGIDPRYDMKNIKEEDFRSLYDSIRNTLREMVVAGGRNTEKDLLGNNGGYITHMCKDTLGTICPKCGGKIEKANYMGGTIYYCPGCQKR